MLKQLNTSVGLTIGITVLMYVPISCVTVPIAQHPAAKLNTFGEHLRSIRNRSPGLPVAEHFNSANHTIDDIRVCGVKQCSGSNTSRKRREMQLIFELGTLNPGGLNINFSFI